MTVDIERDGAVWTVVLDRRAKKNAVDRATASKLAEAFRIFEADDSALAAVLWGAGGTFCAGADLEAIADGEPNRLEADGDGSMGPTRMELSKPVIAAIEGHAVAGGLELALWCDLRVAAADAVFGVFCRRWGVPLIDGGTVRLPRTIGMGRAMDMILTGRSVDADEALDIGLCNRIVDRGDARRRAEELAATIAEFPQQCLRSDRRSAYRQWSRDEARALREEFAAGRQVVGDEGVDGARKFAEGAGRSGSFDDL